MHDWTKIRPSAGTTSVTSFNTVMTPVEVSGLVNEVTRSRVNVVRVNAGEKPEKLGNPGIKPTIEREVPEKQMPKSKQSLGGVRVVKLSKDEIL